MRYVGTLYYKDDGTGNRKAAQDELRVSSFIVRSDELAIQATTTWAGEGNWSIDTVAPRVESDLYVATNVLATQGQKSNRCRLELRVVAIDRDTIGIEGRWIERGSEYSFDGELEAAD